MSRKRSKGKIIKFPTNSNLRKGIGSRGKINPNRIVSESKNCFEPRIYFQGKRDYEAFKGFYADQSLLHQRVFEYFQGVCL
jgi:hypothetical protein